MSVKTCSGVASYFFSRAMCPSYETRLRSLVYLDYPRRMSTPTEEITRRIKHSACMNDYQAAVAETAIYPESGTGSALALAYVGLGLGEAGEIQGKIKKIIRDDAGVVTDATRIAVAKELGDLLWYAARLASEISMPLETIAVMNLNKLSDRRDRGVLQGSGDDR